MSEIDNQAGAFAQQNNERSAETDPFSMFNEPINMDDDDGDDIPIQDDFFSFNANDNQGSEENPDDNNQEAQEQTQENDVDLVFDDEIVEEQKNSDENKTDEELIALAAKRGLVLKKEEVVDVNAERTIELQRLNQSVSNMESFLNLSDEQVVKEKIKAETTRRYIQENKQHLIGTEDFEMELEAEYSQVSEHNSLFKIYADNVRREVQSGLDANKAKVSSINEEIESENKKALTEKRTSLQSSLKSIYQSGIFGIKLTPEESKEIYNSIISGDFSKTVNNDPNVLAEFATYQKFRQQIISKLGGPTYGEGVKAAAEKLNGGALQTETPLASAIRNSSQSATTTGDNNNRKKAWSNGTVAQPTNPSQEKVVVAGTGGFL